MEKARLFAQPARFDFPAVAKRFAAEADASAGAVAFFVGIARRETSGRGVSALEILPTAETKRRLSALVRGLSAKGDVLIYHNTGRFKPGDELVLVAARSAHRSGAFALLKRAITHMKHDVPFKKREVYENKKNKVMVSGG